MSQTNAERLQAIADKVKAGASKDGYYRLNYPGNTVAPFDPDTGTGLIGKVMGQNHPWYGPRWFRVVDAEYDPETDKTTAELQRIIDPMAAAQRLGL